MTISILFIQGAGEGAHDRWDDKLVASLARELGPGYDLRYPRMPGEHDPHYAAWRPVLVAELEALDEGAILVGHSVGGTMLLHVLAEQQPAVKPGAIVAIAAPFIGDGGWPSDELQPRADLAERLPADVPVFLYHGTADPTVPFAHVERYAKLLPQAVVRALAERDHQLGNDLGEVARDLRSLVR